MRLKKVGYDARLEVLVRMVNDMSLGTLTSLVVKSSYGMFLLIMLAKVSLLNEYEKYSDTGNDDDDDDDDDDDYGDD